MALCNRRDYITSVVVAAMVIWMQLLLLIMSAGASGAGAVDDAQCSTGLVYPSGSRCWEPARYIYEGGVYELAGINGGQQLFPEWDEANSTYYVSLADVGAKYAFSHLSREWRSAVALSDDVIIQNVDTGRRLGLRQEGEDEWFLVEAESWTRFQFSKAEDVLLPCILIWPPVQCEAYYILKFNSSLGLSAYEEDGATYFKLAENNLFPFVLLRSSITGTIKMATDAT